MDDTPDPLDKTHFELSPEAWAEFKSTLERPVIPNPRLAKLMARRPVWERYDD